MHLQFKLYSAKPKKNIGQCQEVQGKPRLRNEKMDALVNHVHSSGKFTVDAAHKRIVAAMKKAAAHA